MTNSSCNHIKILAIVITYELKAVGGNLFSDGEETLELKYFNLEDKQELFCKQHEEFWNDLKNNVQGFSSFKSV